MKDHKITRIEISFGAAVTLPDGWERALDGLIGMVCEQYQRENPTRVMWPAGAGSKPQWSQADAAFLGVAPAQGAPADGEPTFDDSVYFVDCAEREDYHGNNPHNPEREAIRTRIAAERRIVREELARDIEERRAKLRSFVAEVHGSARGEPFNTPQPILERDHDHT